MPPIYHILKTLWNWIDQQVYAIPQGDAADLVPLSKRTLWWEYMVEWLLENYGELSLV